MNGVNVVFEHVGAATWEESIRLLSKGGRLVTCGATTGADVDINLAHLFMKQQSILGSTMGTLSALNDIKNLVASGKIIPEIDKVFSMENIRDAHKYVEDSNQFGKVVLVP